jgi:hypothetical protein
VIFQSSKRGCSPIIALAWRSRQANTHRREEDVQMQPRTIGVLMLAAVLGLLVWLYNTSPGEQGLIVFSTIIGLALKRR